MQLLIGHSPFYLEVAQFQLLIAKCNLGVGQSCAQPCLRCLQGERGGDRCRDGADARNGRGRCVCAFQVSQITFNLGNRESALIDALALIDNLATKVDKAVVGAAYSGGQLAALLRSFSIIHHQISFALEILRPPRTAGISLDFAPPAA